MAKVAFLFPGQGAQSLGMGATLVEKFPVAKTLFQDASTILGYDLLEICLNGPIERLNATDISQPAIFVASLAALESLRAAEPEVCEECVATAGLSLGEYTALVFAGALSFADGLRVVQRRGQAMQAAAEATPSAMLSVIGGDLALVEAIVAEARAIAPVQVANYLCPGNTVLSGTMVGIEAADKIATEKGAKTIRLAVAGAFHTDFMKPADERLAEVLREVEFRTPRIPVWSNVDASPHTDPAEIGALLVKQVLSPVQWEATLRGLIADGVERFYEVGPGRVLVGLLKRVNRKIECRNYTA